MYAAEASHSLDLHGPRDSSYKMKFNFLFLFDLQYILCNSKTPEHFLYLKTCYYHFK